MTDTNTTTAPPIFPVDSEVTVTVTGRVITSHGGGLVIEYLRSNGFADRLHVCNGADVEFRAAPPPNAETLAARERAARMVAVACLDPEVQARTGAEWVARWNDAYPPGTPVRYWLGMDKAAAQWAETVTEGAAYLYAGRFAAVRVAPGSDPLSLDHVEPITEEIH